MGTQTSTRRSTTSTAERPEAAARVCSQARCRQVAEHPVSIVKRTDDLTGFQVSPRRWVVERTPAWISKHRRCVRDYETRPEHAEAMATSP